MTFLHEMGTEKLERSIGKGKETEPRHIFRWATFPRAMETSGRWRQLLSVLDACECP